MMNTYVNTTIRLFSLFYCHIVDTYA